MSFEGSKRTKMSAGSEKTTVFFVCEQSIILVPIQQQAVEISHSGYK